VFVVDTNVLVYAADRTCREHLACLERLEEWRRSSLPWYLTWNVLYEFVRVVTHPRVFDRPWDTTAAWSFVGGLLASPSAGVLTHTRRHLAVAAQTLADVPALAGNVVHDAHTAVLMREHGIRRIYTRDTDFHRFPFLEVLDPLA
jgi:hypothetical protein